MPWRDLRAIAVGCERLTQRRYPPEAQLQAQQHLPANGEGLRELPQQLTPALPDRESFLRCVINAPAIGM